MVCEKCGKEFEKDYRKQPKGKAKFCSRECANSRIWTEEDKIKKSISAKNSVKVKEVNKNRDISFFIEAGKKYKEKIKRELLEADYKDLKFGRLKKRVVLEQEGKCNICGLNTWNDEPLVLELEHKDGNHQNNERSNLEALCPNCHSQTKFWRGRNVKSSKEKVIKDEDIFEAFLETGNIRQCLLKLGLAAKGANYGRVKRVLSIRGIKYNNGRES